MVYWKANVISSFARQAFAKASSTGHIGPTAGPVVNAFFTSQFSQRTPSSIQYYTNHAQPQSVGGTNAYYSMQQANPSIALATSANDDSKRDSSKDVKNRHARHISASFLISSGEAHSVESGTRGYATQLRARQLEAADPVFSGEVDVASQQADEFYNEENLNRRLNDFMQEERYNAVLDTYEDLKSKNRLPPVASIYNLVLSAITQTAHWKRSTASVPKMLSVYSDMLSRHISPTVDTYTTVIIALCKRADFVLGMLEGLQTREQFYGYKVNDAEKRALEKEDNVAIALQLFNASMAGQDQHYSTALYNEMLRVLARYGLIDDLLKVFEKMESSSTKPNSATFAHLIWAFGEAGDIRSSLECYNEYKASTPTFGADLDEVVIYRSLLYSYFKAKDPESAVAFFDKLHVRFEGKAMVSVYTEMVRGFCHLGDLEKATFWLEEYNKSKPKTGSWFMYGIIIQAASLAGKHKMALDLWYKASTIPLENEQRPSSNTWMAALKSCLSLKDFNSAFELLDFLLPTLDYYSPEVVESFARELIKEGRNKDVNKLLNILVRTEGVVSTFSGGERFGAVLKAALDEWKLQKNLTWDVAAEFTEYVVLGPSQLAWAQYGPVFPAFCKVYDNMPFTEVPFLSHRIIPVVMGLQSYEVRRQKGNSDKDNKRLISMANNFAKAFPDEVKSQGRNVKLALEIVNDPETLAMWESTCFNDTNQRPASPGFSVKGGSTAIESATNYVAADEPLQQLPLLTFPFDSTAVPFDQRTSRRVSDSLKRKPISTDDIVYLFRKCERAGQVVSFDVFAKAIEVLGRSGSAQAFNEIYGMAQRKLSATTTSQQSDILGWCWIMNAMIIANTHIGRYDTARSFHDKIVELGVSPNANAYASYIHNLNLIGAPDEATLALSYLEEAKAAGVTMQAYIYNTVIAKLSRARKSDLALEIFNEMKSLNIKPTAITFGTMMSVFCRTAREEHAIQMFEEMESFIKFHPSIAPFNTMIQFYVHTKPNRDKVWYYYGKIKQKNVLPSAYTFRLLMDAHIIIEPPDIPGAERILTTISEWGQPATTLHYTALVYAYGNVLNDLDKAANLFNEVEQGHKGPSAKLDELMCQTYMEVLVTKGKVELTNHVLKIMQTHNIGLTCYMANALISGWAQKGNISRARELYDSLDNSNTKHGKEPSTFEAMTRAYLDNNQQQEAAVIVSEMRKQNFPPAVQARLDELYTLNYTKIADDESLNSQNDISQSPSESSDLASH